MSNIRTKYDNQTRKLRHQEADLAEMQQQVNALNDRLGIAPDIQQVLTTTQQHIKQAVQELSRVNLDGLASKSGDVATLAYALSTLQDLTRSLDMLTTSPQQTTDESEMAVYDDSTRPSVQEAEHMRSMWGF